MLILCALGIVFKYIEIYLSVKFFCDRRRAGLFDHEIYHENWKENCQVTFWMNGLVMGVKIILEQDKILVLPLLLPKHLLHVYTKMDTFPG